MAKVVSINNGPDTSLVTLELSEAELKNIETREPVLLFGQNKFMYDTTTRVITGGKGGKSDYFLIPTALKKQFKITNFKDSHKYKCSFIETADSRYMIVKWDK